MAIDTNVVLNEFIRIARDEVGSRLGTVTKQGQQVPAVMLSRDINSKPNTGAYIVVDILLIDDSGSWLIASGVDDSDNPFFASYYKILLQYTTYGEDSLSIAQELKGKFRVERILDEIRTNTTGGIEDVFAVTSVPEKLATAYQEAAAFNLNFTITDVVTDVATGVIETVNVTGDVLLDEEDTFDNPLDLDITVTCPDP